MGSGGKGGGGESTSVDYFGSVVGLLGWGPALSLSGLIVDGKEVWTAEDPILESVSANPFTFDVEGYGRAHFYWGLADQVLLDPVTTVAERDHHPMRRRVFIVLEDFLFGRERTSAPDVSVVWSRAPQQGVLSADGLDGDGQANPASFALELLTDSVNGLGLDAGLFDVASWGALREALAGSAASEFLTISLDDKVSGRRFLQELADYSDVWFRANDEGKLEVGRWQDQSGEIPTITMADLVALSTADFEPESVRETSGRVTVEFVNAENSFQDDHATFQNAARRDLFYQDNLVELQRPWIRRGAQAGKMAARVGEQVAQVGGTLRLEVRETRASELLPGNRFLFSRPDLGWEIVCRVIRRNGDGNDGGAVMIEAEKDRVFSAGVFGGGAATFDGEDAFEIAELDFWDAVQLPSALSGGELYRLAFLAGRTQGLVVYSRPCLRAQAVDEFQTLGIQRSWAVPFQLAQAYPATVTEDDETGTLLLTKEALTLGFDDLDAAPTEDEIADDKWLVFLVDASDSSKLEICTLRSIEPPASGSYPIHVWRARFGTDRLDFIQGDRAYIIQRNSLTYFEWRGLQARALSGSPNVEVKLIPGTASVSLPDADANTKTLNLRDQTGENVIAGLFDGQTALEAETTSLDARVDALENPPPP